MVKDNLTDRLGLVSVLSVKVPVPIGTMLNFDGPSDDEVTCKQTFNKNAFQ